MNQTCMYKRVHTAWSMAMRSYIFWLCLRVTRALTSQQRSDWRALSTEVLFPGEGSATSHNPKGIKIEQAHSLFSRLRANPKKMKWFLLWMSTIFLVNTTTEAGYGDYVDPTFNCPAMTTCKQVCVASAADCPIQLICNATQTHCQLEGICVDDPADCDPQAEPVCAYGCASVACPKLVIGTLDSCEADFGEYWAQESACGEQEYEDTVTLLTFREPAFVFFYCWICVVTTIILAWCFYNQRISPVQGSCAPLQVQGNSSSFQKSVTQIEIEKGSHGWQTGYKTHVVGTFIYFLTILTLFGIQGLLGWLTIQYYIQQESILHLNGRFEDEQQCLKAFIIAWMVGFCWSFSLKWPYSIRSMFLRRCLICQATHIAICVGRMGDDTQVTYEKGYIQGLRHYVVGFYELFWVALTALFSEYTFFGVPRRGDGVFVVCPVLSGTGAKSYFTFLFRRYNLTGDSFVPGTWNVGDSIEQILTHKSTTGLTAEEVTERVNVVGKNQIEMNKPTFWNCLYKELAKPFYTYQSFMVWSWFPFWYFYMAIVWTFVIMTGALTVTYFQYRNETNLFRITKQVGKVEVVRDGRKNKIAFEEMVPGDLVCLSSGMAFADMLLVDSEAILVDESAITGEATPVGITPMDATLGKDFYSRLLHKRNTLLAGTTVLESDESALAIVLSTASFTARGELLREIMSYKRHQFKFDVEVPIVITILFFYAIFGFAMTFYFIGEQFIYGWFYGMYVVGTILPPLLPTVFTVSVGICDNRLSQKNITCTNSESILVAGKVTRAFFDKTGTLTKQGLDFQSTRNKMNWGEGELGGVEDALMAMGMAVCHSLVPSKNTSELIGNPVDRTMFEASGARIKVVSGESKLLQITDKTGKRVQVLKHFDFDHHRMTQSVVVKTDQNVLIAFVKGSDESIKKLCVTDTLPSDFDTYSKQCARDGYYQISMASKVLKADTALSKLSRDDLESALAFVGVINFKNAIRPETFGVISHLTEGEVVSTMVTGDSVLTGICIAKEAGILKSDATIIVGEVDADDKVKWVTPTGEQTIIPATADACLAANIQLAVSGAAWNSLLVNAPEEAIRLLNFVRVYGRCTPYDKVLVVTSHVKLGYITLMCGDGGNDCGALKAAHVGVSLSDAEASIVAPFTSLDKSIESVVTVLLEGRCSLASALAAYKFMIMYGQIESINQMINAHLLITFSEFCWVFMDGIWTITLAFGLSLAKPAHRLSPSRPTASLLGLHTLSSVIGVLAINFLFTVSALFYLWAQDWYQCRAWENTDVSNLLVIGDNYETETIFLVTGFQYIASAIVFNFAYEFRKGYFYNWVFVAFSTVYAGVQLYITLRPGDLSCLWRVNCINENVQKSVTFEPIPIQNEFNTTIMPDHYQRGLVGIMVGNLIAICTWDYFVVNGIRRYYGKKRRDEEAERIAGLIANPHATDC
eukprot:Nitzschia sp. Nitz4//scaffold97_size77645//7752//12969//NITZ4_005511-RA/size77645-processed-gene-0.50-mRNA-1//-1//CDS//3329560635//8457//frame0